MDILRIKSQSGGRDQVETHFVPIARDNLVCAICDARLVADGEWVVVSHPQRKGVVVFACRECAEKAIALLSKLL